MVTTTSSIPTGRRHQLSTAAALLLTIGGNILVIGIAAVALVGVGVAALAVFGPVIFDAL